MKESLKKEVEQIIENKNLNCSIDEFKDEVNWNWVLQFQTLSEDFIREFKDKVDWYCISQNQTLSENFIREFKNNVKWECISIKQTLSGNFIREFQDKVDWEWISQNQTLSENFIREFKDKVNWDYISINQTLSENFIREFQDKVDWNWISRFQTLLEDFIREFKDKVNWDYISTHQTLSENFIREFQNKVNWYLISRNQTLLEDFIREFNVKIPEACWIYKTTKEKIEHIKENEIDETYKCHLNNEEPYLIAFKSVKANRESVYKLGIFYQDNQSYEAHCDCNTNNENSFGLSAWTKEGALNYHSKGKLLKVKIYLKDLGCFVHNNHKIRTRKLTVIEEV